MKQYGLMCNGIGKYSWHDGLCKGAPIMHPSTLCKEAGAIASVCHFARTWAQMAVVLLTITILLQFCVP